MFARLENYFIETEDYIFGCNYFLKQTARERDLSQ